MNIHNGLNVDINVFGTIPSGWQTGYLANDSFKRTINIHCQVPHAVDLYVNVYRLSVAIGKYDKW